MFFFKQISVSKFYDMNRNIYSDSTLCLEKTHSLLPPLELNGRSLNELLMNIALQNVQHVMVPASGKVKLGWTKNFKTVASKLVMNTAHGN